MGLPYVFGHFMEQTYVFEHFGHEAPDRHSTMVEASMYQAAARVVLVVEDEALLRASIAEELRHYGPQVLEAASGEHALTLMTNNHVDVVFTDIQLAGVMSGWEMTEALRATSPDVSVLYTSGNACDPTRQVSGSLFIGKPYDSGFVIEACHILLADAQGNP
jgi:CheY-like chemotaxis protein